MRHIKLMYETVWLKVHPVWQDANGRALYPSWRASYLTARILVGLD